MAITIINQQKKILPRPRRIILRTHKILRHEKVCHADLSLVFVTDKTIHRLNRKFLSADYPTDVLAFDFSSAAPGTSRRSAWRRAQQKTLRGEIIISVRRAELQAKVYGLPFETELMLYVIHGVLHLLGYDDHRPKDIQRMRKKEAQLLKLLA